MRTPWLSWGIGVCVLVMAAGLDSAAALRDPFTFGTRRTEAPDTSAEPAAAGQRLIGIFWDGPTPLAMVGGQLLSVGQTVAGWTVVEITANQVVLQQGAQREHLRLGSQWPSGMTEPAEPAAE